MLGRVSGALFVFSACLLVLPLQAELSPAAVRAAADYSAAQRGLSLLVIQGGRTLLEEYPGGGSARAGRKIYSGTKAFWCLAALAAAEDGLLRLDEPVAATVPEWAADPRKSRITIRQLLDFSAGLDPAFFLHNDDPGNRDTIALSLPAVAEPGRAFVYGPSALQAFHFILKSRLKGEAPTHYLERRVLRRLGLGPQRYLKDRAGNPLLASGCFCRPANGLAWANWFCAAVPLWCQAVRWRNAGAVQRQIGPFPSAGGTIATRRGGANSTSKLHSTQSGTGRTGTTPRFAAMLPATSWPASARCISGSTSCLRWSSSSCGTVVAADSPMRASCVSC